MRKKKLQNKLQELLALAERDRIDIREEISPSAPPPWT